LPAQSAGGDVPELALLLWLLLLLPTAAAWAALRTSSILSSYDFSGAWPATIRAPALLVAGTMSPMLESCCTAEAAAFQVQCNRIELDGWE
jgi:hypothetical protein